jgi:hypothetical protein
MNNTKEVFKLCITAGSGDCNKRAEEEFSNLLFH